jgi:ribosomal protein S18 acetylase RimI-like enzyme
MGEASDDRYARTAAFWRWLQERVCTHREDLPWGVAFLDLDYPLRFDSNHLFVDHPVPGMTTVDLHREAERILGGAGLKHREVQMAADQEGHALAMGFAELGYVADHLVVMAHEDEPAKEVPAVAEIVDFQEARPAIAASFAAQPWADSEEVVRCLTDYRVKLEREIGARFYAARVDGAIAAHCELYVGPDGVAQVEDVNTAEAYRGRGLASACVMRAVRDARDAGADLVFLYADANDWPQHLYTKLGFRPVGHAWEFLKWPGGKPVSPGIPASV